MSESVTVSVQILGKPFQVSCGVDEAEQVTAAARLLDARMSEIHDTRKVLGFDRIAVMAALNIAHDYLASNADLTRVSGAAGDKVAELTDKVTQALAEAEA